MKKITIDLPSGTHIVPIYTVDDFPYDKIPTNICHGKNCDYYNIPATYDIETTSIKDVTQTIAQGKDVYTGFMYIWQFCICDMVVMGRTWEEYVEFLDTLKIKLHLSEHLRLCIYVHYLAFEFQFTRNFLDIESVFARKKRVPLKVDANNAFEFRCSYFLSNMSLDKLIKNTPNAIFNKQSGEDFDYSKIRLPNTVLSELELGYCYCDVRGLSEAIAHFLKEDTIATIPLTSTGFLRREVRKEVLSNPKNKEEIQRCQLSPEQYVLCKSAARGGNTHANAIFTDTLIDDNMGSKDRVSSYPAEMIVGLYPVTAFVAVRPSKENFDTLINNKAVLMDITLRNISLKKIACMPYIPFAKLTHCTNPICDNGRISSADEISLVITDIDYKIIESQYNFDEDIEIKSLNYAEYGKLNNEFRELLMDFFKQKTILKGGDIYLYNKFKNKINAFFGMMLTDICNPNIIYNPNAKSVWSEDNINVEEMLTKHYNSRNTFLTYQHGLWVTANARKRLQEGLDCVGEDAVYCDTDSVKYVGNHDKDFERVNSNWLKACDENDIKPYVDFNGKRHYLGVWENDGEYKQFVTLGAKKYAYIMKGSDTLAHITVAGLSKEKGAKWLNNKAKELKCNPLELFAVGTVIPQGSSGRTVAYYNDNPYIYEITVNGVKFTTSSNIAVVNANYTFGISDDYEEYLENETTHETRENRLNEKNGELN